MMDDFRDWTPERQSALKFSLEKILPDDIVENLLKKPGDHQATIQVLQDLRNDSVKWLENKCDKKDVPNPDELWDDFEGWLNQLNVLRMNSLLSCNHDLPWIEKKYSPILKKLRKHFKAEIKPPAPLVRIFVEWLATTIEYMSPLQEVKDSAPNILVDSNIILDLLVEDQGWHEEARQTWDCLTDLAGEKPLKIHLLALTLDELRRVTANAEHHIAALKLRLQRETPLQEVRREITRLAKQEPLAFELILNADINSTQFADDIVLRAINEKGVATGVPSNWSSVVVDETAYVPRSQQLEKLDALYKSAPELKRGRAQDLHDVALLSYAEERAKSKDERWFIWTHHRNLADYALAMKVHNAVISWGMQIIFSLWKPGSKEDTEETVRDLVRRYLVKSAKRTSQNKIAITASKVRKAVDATAATIYEPGRGRIPPPVDQRDMGASGEDKLEEVPLKGAAPWPSRPSIGDTLIPASLLEDNGPDEWVDLTLDLADACGGHTVPKPEISTDSNHVVSWKLWVHALTHVDLPWAVDIKNKDVQDNWINALPHIFETQQQMLQDLLTVSRAFPVLTLDLTELRNRMNEKLGGTGKLLPPEPKAKEIADLMLGLQIGIREMRDRLDDFGDMHGKILLLHTGWAASYLRKGSNLKSIGETTASRWSFHPWLTCKLVDELAKHRPFAIAADMPMLDCPLYVIARTRGASQEWQRAYEIVMQEKLDGDEKTPGIALGGIQPAHSKLLPAGTMLIENVHIPEEATGDWYLGSKLFRSEMLLFFLKFAIQVDAAICKLFIHKPRR